MGVAVHVFQIFRFWHPAVAEVNLKLDSRGIHLWAPARSSYFVGQGAFRLHLNMIWPDSGYRGLSPLCSPSVPPHVVPAGGYLRLVTPGASLITHMSIRLPLMTWTELRENNRRRPCEYPCLDPHVSNISVCSFGSHWGKCPRVPSFASQYFLVCSLSNRRRPLPRRDTHVLSVAHGPGVAQKRPNGLLVGVCPSSPFSSFSLNSSSRSTSSHMSRCCLSWLNTSTTMFPSIPKKTGWPGKRMPQQLWNVRRLKLKDQSLSKAAHLQ